MKVLAAFVVAVVAGLGVWAVLGLAADEDKGSRAEAILESPDEFAGERVTVAGEVESFFPGAFTIGESSWGEEMLVVPAGDVQLPRAIRDRAARPRVEVTGVVRIKDDSVELAGGEEAEPFAGKPYVSAERIVIAGSETGEGT